MKPRAILPMLALLVSCGSDPDLLSPNAFFQKRPEAECAAVSSACLVTVPACVAGREAEYTAEYQAALRVARDFVPSNAQACLAKVEDVYGKLDQGKVAIGAADYRAMTSVCANVYRGSSAANGPCRADVDCVADLICDKGYCATRKLVAAGAGCANPGESCPPGSYCRVANGVWLCSAKVGAQGDCTVAPCTETLRCAAGVCLDRLAIGESCAADSDCKSGFCEPFAARCAEDIRFANGSAACRAMGGI
jgi:hypothetical protein